MRPEPHPRSASPTPRARRLAAATLLVLLVAAAASARSPILDALAWLEGRWQREGSSPPFFEEWRRSGDVLLGEGWRDAGDGDRVLLEDLLLVELAGEIYYFAAVSHNRWPTPFRLVSSGAEEARFENPDHDDPRAIVYRRQGERLLVILEGEGSPRELSFRRVP